MAAENKGGNTSLASSMTDLMTSLMVIFVLLLVATLNNASAAGENTRSIILEQLTTMLRDFAKEGVSVGKDPKDPLGLLVLVPEKALNFKEGGDEISESGGSFLRKFTPLLAETTCGENFRSKIGSIVAEGYTNSNGNDESNLGLSQRRSLKVVQNMLLVLGKDDPNIRSCFLDFISANGRGSRDPITVKVNGVEIEDKERSRRVLFKIRIRSSEQPDLRSRLGM